MYIANPKKILAEVSANLSVFDIREPNYWFPFSLNDLTNKRIYDIIYLRKENDKL